MSQLLNPDNKAAPAAQNGANRVSYVTPLANILETKDGYVL